MLALDFLKRKDAFHNYFKVCEIFLGRLKEKLLNQIQDVDYETALLKYS